MIKFDAATRDTWFTYNIFDLSQLCELLVIPKNNLIDKEVDLEKHKHYNLNYTGLKCLTLEHLFSTKRSYILKQTCSCKLQVCFSMYELLVDTRHWRIKAVLEGSEAWSKLGIIESLCWTVYFCIARLYKIN